MVDNCFKSLPQRWGEFQCKDKSFLVLFSAHKYRRHKTKAPMAFNRRG